MTHLFPTVMTQRSVYQYWRQELIISDLFKTRNETFKENKGRLCDSSLCRLYIRKLVCWNNSDFLIQTPKSMSAYTGYRQVYCSVGGVTRDCFFLDEFTKNLVLNTKISNCNSWFCGSCGFVASWSQHDVKRFN